MRPQRTHSAPQSRAHSQPPQSTVHPQPPQVAAQHAHPNPPPPAGKYVNLPDTISGFKGVLEGKYDDLPEMAFYMNGDINEVCDKADKMAAEMASKA